ncbi:mRNA-decapping enzyme-like protein [Dendronephthya gigantea]|uniref:mRNA-decapping enzyme-like protein n=1 Tax=Dendronephthya gigantea TaxID=151771 RepID=UPI00106D8438|nr:mRNA-decapping enzyme-like protein [Dendronephthya gigantea]XP_028398174.1 mRNA-decapping enzyme-like protein [Dendronephthya gigantea]
MEEAAVDQELKINLAALRKSDRFVLDILETSAQVALYKFEPQKQEWEKTEVEGSLFLYRRSTLPKFALMIMNRLNRDNLNEYITKEMEFKVQKPFLLYKNSSGEILGIWFNNPEKCAKVGEHIARLYASPPPTQDENKEKSQGILELFANAQKRFDEKNKVYENGVVEPSSLSQAQNIDNGKLRSLSLTGVPPTHTSPLTFLPSAIENEDIQSQTLHDPCIVKSSPLRPSPKHLSRSLPNSAKKAIPKQLFIQELAPPTNPNQEKTEKVPLPSVPSQNASSAKSRPAMTKQGSSTDLSTGATALMSPMAFKTTKSQSTAPKDPNVDMIVLTKEQLQETLITLLERDSIFLTRFTQLM